MAVVRAVVLCGILVLLCCRVHGDELEVQGIEGGTVRLNLTSLPQPVDESKNLSLVIVYSNGTAQTVLYWPEDRAVDMAKVQSEQFRGRMSLISDGEPGQHQGPAAVRITDLRPSDAVTGGYFQFRQPGVPNGKPMKLHVIAAKVTTLTTSTSAAMATAATTPTSVATAIVTATPHASTTTRVTAPTTENVSVAKKFITWTLGVKTAQQLNSAEKSDNISTEAIISYVLGGMMFVIVIVAVAVVVWSRRTRNRETDDENATNEETGRPEEEMPLQQSNGSEAGTRTHIAQPPLVLLVRTSSFSSSYEEEQNNINSTRPLLPKQRPKLHTIPDSTNMDIVNHTVARSAATQTPVDSPTDNVFHLNEVSRVSTPRSEEATQALDDNTDPKAASSGHPVNRGTEESSPAINTQSFSTANRSMSSDESAAAEPHSLRSGQANSRNLPQLEDMISCDTGTEPTQNGVSTDPKKLPTSGQIKKPYHPNKASSSREGTRPDGGFCATMGTMMEHTMEEDTGGGQVSNQEGPRVDVSDLRAMSLSGNEVATTIDQMLRKEPSNVGNLNIPYRKFSQLCLQLYNTQNNWKILADRLGLTSGDILLIDSCSAQHNLPAAEIVLRHWQRTARHDRTASTPCTLQNLKDILQDMGRADLVSMIDT